MSASPLSATAERRRAMLCTAMGPVISAALNDPAVVEVLANPDGRLWIERHGTGRADSGARLAACEAERIIRLVASHIGQDCDARRPLVSAELPLAGERFEGVLPPVSSAPCFAIRKPSAVLFRIGDYVASDVLSASHAAALGAAIAERRNILVAGGTGSGKTTFVNALLAEIAAQGDRLVLIEDTRELQCLAEDAVHLRTHPGVVTLADLVRSTMRLRPDRIVVGEVRGTEALDMLKAWNTGHPGGVATIHANSARGALYRLEQLIQEVVASPPRALIATAIDIIVFLAGRGEARRVQAIETVEGLGADGDYRLASLPALRLISRTSQEEERNVRS